MSLPFRALLLPVAAVFLVGAGASPPAVAQASASVVVRPDPLRPAGAGQRTGNAERRAGRFWPSAGAALLGGTLGGGLGWLLGYIDLPCGDRARTCRDEEQTHIAAVVPGAWLGVTIGALAGARADIDSHPEWVLLAGSAALLGGATGAALGTVAADGRPWAGASGAMLGAAGSAAFSMWAAARNAPSARRVALLNVGANGAAGVAVPALERRPVPLTAQRGWNVPVLSVQL